VNILDNFGLIGLHLGAERLIQHQRRAQVKGGIAEGFGNRGLGAQYPARDRLVFLVLKTCFNLAVHCVVAGKCPLHDSFQHSLLGLEVIKHAGLADPRLDGDGIRTVARLAPAGVPGGTTVARGGLCAFEAIYLARPDSVLFGQSVHGLRKEMGRELAREHPAPGDLVTGVPDSSLSAAMGYAEELGLPYEMGLVRNRYVGRTFIQPAAGQRRLSVNAKLNAVRKVVQGRRVVLVDDSIVRGTTARRIVQLLRDAGAREVHVRIASPPYRFPCHYGVDTARREELIAYDSPVEAIRAAIGADSLAFLSLARMRRVLGGPACEACFTGRYPVPVDGAVPKMALEPVAVEEGDAG